MLTGICHEPFTHSARIRTAQGTAEVYVGREFPDVNKARISYSYVSGAQGANTPTWRTVTSTVTAPSNAKFVRIWLVNYNNSNSTAWFDDIEFTPVNGNYSLVSASDYYPFGSVSREWTNTTPDIGKFKYQQKERDIETGYDYFEARTYDSQIGRFLQVDPHEFKYPFVTPYNAMFNNPLSIVDPTGMDGSDGLPNTNADLDDKDNLFDWTSKDGKKKEEKKEEKRNKVVKRFKSDEILNGLKEMIAMSNAGGTEAFAKETVGLFVEGEGGAVELLVFDNSENTANKSELPTLDSNKDAQSGETTYSFEGQLVLGIVHTHPGLIKPPSSRIYGGRTNPSPADESVFESNGLPNLIVAGSAGNLNMTQGTLEERIGRLKDITSQDLVAKIRTAYSKRKQ